MNLSVCLYIYRQIFSFLEDRRTDGRIFKSHRFFILGFRFTNNRKLLPRHPSFRNNFEICEIIAVVSWKKRVFRLLLHKEAT